MDTWDSLVVPPSERNVDAEQVDGKVDLLESLKTLSNQRGDRGHPLECYIWSPGLLDWKEITEVERIV